MNQPESIGRTVTIWRERLGGDEAGNKKLFRYPVELADFVMASGAGATERHGNDNLPGELPSS